MELSIHHSNGQVALAEKQWKISGPRSISQQTHSQIQINSNLNSRRTLLSNLPTHPSPSQPNLSLFVLQHRPKNWTQKANPLTNHRKKSPRTKISSNNSKRSTEHSTKLRTKSPNLRNGALRKLLSKMIPNPSNSRLLQLLSHSPLRNQFYHQ